MPSIKDISALVGGAFAGGTAALSVAALADGNEGGVLNIPAAAANVTKYVVFGVGGAAAGAKMAWGLRNKSVNRTSILGAVFFAFSGLMLADSATTPMVNDSSAISMPNALAQALTLVGNVAFGVMAGTALASSDNGTQAADHAQQADSETAALTAPAASAPQEESQVTPDRRPQGYSALDTPAARAAEEGSYGSEDEAGGTIPAVRRGAYATATINGTGATPGKGPRSPLVHRRAAAPA